MATRATYKRLDILSPDPTATGADLIQDNTKIIDDVIAAIPTGGTSGQVLTKSSSTNYDTAWVTPSSSSGGTTYTAGTGITIEDAEISVTANTYAAASHTHAYSAITNTPTLATVATSGSYNDLTNKPTIPDAYSLPTASADTLGGVKVGTGLTISNGVLSANNSGSGTQSYSAGTGITIANNTISVTSNTYADKTHTHAASDITSGTLDIARLPTGSTSSTVALGNHSHSYSEITNTPSLATVATSGSYNDLSNLPSIPSAYTLPEASSDTLGGIKVGTNLSISNGVLSAADTTYSTATTSSNGLMSSSDKTKLDGIADNANNYTLPTASTSTLGGVKVDGSTITISNGIISSTASGGSSSYTLPTASTDTLGGVKIDGSTITISNGVISAATSSGTNGTTLVTNGSNKAIKTAVYTGTQDAISIGTNAVDLQLYRTSNACASGWGAFTAGYNNAAGSDSAIAMGNGNNAYGANAVALGIGNSVNMYSTGTGYYNDVGGTYAFVTGGNNYGYANYSSTFGYSNKNYGTHSITLGNQAYNSFSYACHADDNSISYSDGACGGGFLSFTLEGYNSTYDLLNLSDGMYNMIIEAQAIYVSYSGYVDMMTYTVTVKDSAILTQSGSTLYSGSYLGSSPFGMSNGYLTFTPSYVYGGYIQLTLRYTVLAGSSSSYYYYE